MTNRPGTIAPTVGNPVGLRTWGEDGFKPSKDDRGWADSRVSAAAAIARWGDWVMSASTLVSLQRLADAAHDPPRPTAQPAPAPGPSAPPTPLETHPAGEVGTGWKPHRNNRRLLLPPAVCSCLLFPWRALVPPPHAQAVQTGLATLGPLVHTFRLALPP